MAVSGLAPFQTFIDYLVKRADFASSKRFRVGGPLDLAYEDKYSAVGPFD